MTDDLERRVAKLEGRNRWLIGGIVTAFAFLFATLVLKEGPETIQARSIRANSITVEDELGRPRLTMQASAGGVAGLTLITRCGIPKATLTEDMDGEVALNLGGWYTENSAAVRLGTRKETSREISAALHIYNWQGGYANVAEIVVPNRYDPDGPFLLMSDPGGQPKYLAFGRNSSEQPLYARTLDQNSATSGSLRWSMSPVKMK